MIKKRSDAIINKKINLESESPISITGEAILPEVKVSYRESQKVSNDDKSCERIPTLNKDNQQKRLDTSSSGYCTPLMPKLENKSP